MNRLTNDNPKGDIQTALNLFYIKDYETFVRGGGPGPEYADISLYDFTRQIIKANIPDVDLNIDDDSLAVMIDEWRFDGPESIEGVIALLYTAAWSFSTLRRRLAAYEDTGLEPEEVEALKKRNCAGRSVPVLGTDRIRELMALSSSRNQNTQEDQP